MSQLQFQAGDKIYLLNGANDGILRIEFEGSTFAILYDENNTPIFFNRTGNVSAQQIFTSVDLSNTITIADDDVIENANIDVLLIDDGEGPNPFNGVLIKSGEIIVAGTEITIPSKFGFDTETFKTFVGNNQTVGTLLLENSRPYFTVADEGFALPTNGNAYINGGALDPIAGYFANPDYDTPLTMNTNVGQVSYQLGLGEADTFTDASGNLWEVRLILVGSSIYELTLLGEGGPGVPCLTNTCNVLTPSGYRNVSEIKQGDMVTTSDNRQVEVQRVLTTTLLTKDIKPRLIKSHQFGQNQPIVDTHISDWHAYQEQGMWKLPKKSNLPKDWSGDKVTFYHLELPDYYNDNLVVNGLVMEAWDGKMPHEIREYVWKKVGKKFVRQIL